MARPDGFEPPTTWFEARYSIQLSYGRVADGIIIISCITRLWRLKPGIQAAVPAPG
jgi:hypothetical protein